MIRAPEVSKTGPGEQPVIPQTLVALIVPACKKAPWPVFAELQQQIGVIAVLPIGVSDIDPAERVFIHPNQIPRDLCSRNPIPGPGGKGTRDKFPSEDGLPLQQHPPGHARVDLIGDGAGGDLLGRQDDLGDGLVRGHKPLLQFGAKPLEGGQGHRLSQIGLQEETQRRGVIPLDNDIQQGGQQDFTVLRG